MKKSQQIIRLNSASFRLGAEAVRSGRLEMLLEETLAQVLGDGTTCTTFACSVYAPPPPSDPSGGG